MLLKSGPSPGSESPTFVSTVLHDQGTGSAMNITPALQEEKRAHMNLFFSAQPFSLSI